MRCEVEFMKTCPDCKKELSKSAKVCPNCGKKLKKPIFLFIILGIIVLAIIGAMISNKEEKERKKDFSQNETATYKDVEYSIIKVEKTQGSNEYVKPKEGYEYVKVTIKIVNKSKEKISYNELDWKMVNSDGVEDTFGTFTLDNDTTLNSGDLDAGGKIEGVLIWEQKKDDNNLKLRYYETIFDEDYKIQFTLD